MKAYLLIQNGIFGSLSFTFTPIFYSVIAIRVAMEFWDWHKNLIIQISLESLQIETGIIEEFRLRYENLVRIVRFTDKFMSSFLGINLILHIANICFLSYNVIMYWVIWKDFSPYIIYGIFILGMLVFSCSMVTYKVGIMNSIMKPP